MHANELLLGTAGKIDEVQQDKIYHKQHVQLHYVTLFFMLLHIVVYIVTEC